MWILGKDISKCSLKKWKRGRKLLLFTWLLPILAATVDRHLFLYVTWKNCERNIFPSEVKELTGFWLGLSFLSGTLVCFMYDRAMEWSGYRELRSDWSITLLSTVSQLLNTHSVLYTRAAACSNKPGVYNTIPDTCLS